MKLKKYALIALILFCHSACAPPDMLDENFVHDFYIWYGNELLKGNQSSPLYNNMIYKYVSKCTIDRLRIDYKRKFIDSDYFIKANDFWRELLGNFVVKNRIIISDSITIVPVIFHVEEKKHPIFVFIENKNGLLYIIKVEDAYHHF
jgi:hypothetical protein